MKKLMIVLGVLLFAAGSAVAGANVELWGNMEVEGNYYDNYYLAPNNTITWSDYEMEIELWLKLLASENTFVTTRFNMLDDIWAQGQGREVDIDLDRSGNDDNIAVERGFLTHIFSNGTKLEAGLMDSDTWGTRFGDNLAGNYRIQATHETAAGTLIGFVQKDRENGSDQTFNNESEDDDSDQIGVGLKTTLGAINFMPQIVYAVDSNLVQDDDNDGRKTTTFTVAVSGGKDNLGFEGEFTYQNVDYSGYTVGLTPVDDANLFGVYANVWANMDANKIGLIFAYANYDDEAGQGFDMGDDFDVTILLDEAVPYLFANAPFNVNLNPTFYGGLSGLTLAQVYANVAINNRITVMPSLTYFASSDDLTVGLNGPDVDANAYELNVGADYKITDMLTYSAAVAFAKIDAEVGGADIDDIDALRFLHKLSLDF